MTGAIVTQSGQFPFEVTGGPGMAESSKGDFREVFQEVSDKSVRQQEGEDVSPAPITKGIRVKDEQGNVVAQNVAKQKPEKTEELPEELTAGMIACADALKNELMSAFSVTEEELAGVMEALGLTEADLFTQEGMTALVMEFTNIDSAVDLLTNEDAYAMVMELTETADSLLSEFEADFQMTAEDAKNLLQQMGKELQQDEATMTETDAKIFEVSDNSETSDAEGDTEIRITNENVTVTETTAKEANAAQEQNPSTEQNQEQNIAANPQVGQVTVSHTTETAFQETLGAQDVSAQEIYDQITEYMRTNVSGDFSEVEMQLNPENLGKVQIHLTSKQGVVSAQFVTQNEAVKGVIESQLIQLKEQFEEQGIKVDNVEVAVASYSFDQGLNRESQQQLSQSAEARKMTIRRINLNEELTEEELTQEEQIAAEMMAANGNTVDFTA